MMRSSYILGLLFVSLFCSGCLPWRVTGSPGASGVVLDAKTYATIGGAQAVIYRSYAFTAADHSYFPTNARPPFVTTSKDGKFSIPRERKWSLYFPLAEQRAPTFSILMVKHDGYQPAIIYLSTLQRMTSNEAEQQNEQKQILLKPISQ